MSDHIALPTDLLWRNDGHVSDVVLDSLADGQDEVVPAVARDHVNACNSCTQRLGDAVMLAMRVGAAIEEVVLTTAVASQPRAWPIPIPALLAAVVLAVLGSLPALGDLAVRVTEFEKSVITIVPNLTRAVLALSRTGLGDLSTQLAALSMFSVAILLICGFAIARAAPRESPAEGGAQ